MTELAPTSWTIEPLDPRTHDRSNFDCGVAALNDWLARRATQFVRRDMARVYVLIESGGSEVKGYYALSNHALTHEALTNDQASGLPKIDVPVILIGQIALDRSVQGRGLGEFLLVNALHRAEYLSTAVGIRAVEVDAVNESARRFCLKYGFTPLRDNPRHLYLPIHVVRKLELPPL